jgi:hypothetical protein
MRYETKSPLMLFKREFTELITTLCHLDQETQSAKLFDDLLNPISFKMALRRARIM